MRVERASRGFGSAVLEWLGTALLLLLPVLCAWHTIEGLKAGKILSPYSRGLVFFSQQDDARSFWIVIALYAVVGVVTALIAVRILKALWKRWQH
jgi:hypothetical protein